MGFFSLITGKKGPSGFGSASTAEEVTQGLDASDITAIVTGGASGIGEETSRVLALRGAHVIIAARNMEAAERTKKLITKSNPLARVDTMKLDLCSFKSIRAFCNDFIARALPLNLLINNAGIMFCPFQLSEDGIETQFATNHIGHFLLTNLLLEKMKTTATETGIEGRIVNLSSVLHRYPYVGGIPFKTLNEKSREDGANITANSVHPGIIMTNLMRHSSFQTKVIRFFSFPIWKNVPQGAATTCYVALHPSLKGVTGKYFCDCNETKASKYGRNEAMGKRLWEFSEALIRTT